jgi:hypothetical protein
MYQPRWHPTGAREFYGVPEVGWLIGWNYDVWRVAEIVPWAEEFWREQDHEIIAKYGAKAAPVHMLLRPALFDSPDPVAAGRVTKSITIHPFRHRVLVFRDEHYPVCARCGEPTPCRELEAQRIAEREMARMERYCTPGVCPSCDKPVSERQKSIVFMENVLVPAGPPLVFHLRQQCRWDAMAYEKKWVAADPRNRTYSLQCPGEVTRHAYSRYECTVGDACLGPEVHHSGGYHSCGCEPCHPDGRTFDCHPRAGDVRIDPSSR